MSLAVSRRLVRAAAPCRAPILAARLCRLPTCPAALLTNSRRRSVLISTACASSNGTISERPISTAVEYSVGGSTYACSTKSGSAGQLLRLVEQSQDSEYVLLVPAAVAEILQDILHKAVKCLADGASRPLEIHHHVQLGDRGFSCSMTYDPTRSSSSSSSVAESVVQVTVQEKGRSCVQLQVCQSALPAVNRLIRLLEHTAAGAAGAAGGVSGRSPGDHAAVIADTEAAGRDCKNGNRAADARDALNEAQADSNGSSNRPQLCSEGLSGHSQESAGSSSSGSLSGRDSVGDSSSSTSSAVSFQEKLDLLEGLAAVTKKLKEKSNRAKARPDTQQDDKNKSSSSGGSSTSRSSSNSSITSGTKVWKFNTTNSSISAQQRAPENDNDEQQQNVHPADAESSAVDAAAAGPAAVAAASQTMTSSNGAAPPAKAAATSNPSSPVAPDSPEELLSAIMTSQQLSEGMALAHAAASSPAGTFSMVHLVALWSQLPRYAVAAESRLGLKSPEGQADEGLQLGARLHPQVQEQVQEFAAVLVPLLQPQLIEMPLGMLEVLLSSALQVHLQLPRTFIMAWAAAIVAAAEFRDLPTGHLLEITQVLASLFDDSSSSSSGSTRSYQQQQGLAGLDAAALPLEWAVPVMVAAAGRLQVLLQQQSQGEGGVTEADKQQREADAYQLMELIVELLVSCGHHVQQQQLCDWDSDNSNQANSWVRGIFSSLTTIFAGVTAAGAVTAVTAASATFESQQESLLRRPSQHQQQQDPQQLEHQRQLQLQLQGLLLDTVVQLPSSPRSAVTELLWKWLVTGGGAQQVNSSSLLQMMQVLPYNAAAAAYAASSSASLLGKVLHLHGSVATVGNSSSCSSTAHQLAAVSGLLGLALEQDPQAAFTALPALLQLLPSSPAAADTSEEDLAAGLEQLCHVVDVMLEMDCEGVAARAVAVARAVSVQAASPACPFTGLRQIMTLIRDLVDAVSCLHDSTLDTAAAAAAASKRNLASIGLEAAHAWTRAQGVESCSSSTHADLGVVADTVDTIAVLHDLATFPSSLAPGWLQSSSCDASDPNASKCQEQLQQLILAAVAAAKLHPDSHGHGDVELMSGAAVAASALSRIGVLPEGDLLCEFIKVPPVGLTDSCMSLWITAGLLVKQHVNSNSSNSSSSSSGGPADVVSDVDLLQLATEACSSLSSVPAVADSGKYGVMHQCARATWAVAALLDPLAAWQHSQTHTTTTAATTTITTNSSSSSSSSSGSQYSWSPPALLWPWLQDTWRVITAAAAGSMTAGEQREVVQQQLPQLQPGEVSDLLWSLQKLRLMRSPVASSNSSNSSSSVQPAPSAGVVLNAAELSSSTGNASSDSVTCSIESDITSQQHTPEQEPAADLQPTQSAAAKSPKAAVAAADVKRSAQPEAAATATAPEAIGSSSSSSSRSTGGWQPISTDLGGSLTLDSFFLDDFGAENEQPAAAAATTADEEEDVDNSTATADDTIVGAAAAADTAQAVASAATVVVQPAGVASASGLIVNAVFSDITSAAPGESDTLAAVKPKQELAQDSLTNRLETVRDDQLEATAAAAAAEGEEEEQEEEEEDFMAAAEATVLARQQVEAAAAGVAAADEAARIVVDTENEEAEILAMQSQQHAAAAAVGTVANDIVAGQLPTAATATRADVDTSAAAPMHTAAAAAATWDGSVAGTKSAPGISGVLEQLRARAAAGSRPVRREALQLLVPVQQQALTLPGPDLLLYVQTCLQYNITVPAEQVMAAAQAALTSATELQPDLLLQLLSALGSAADACAMDGHVQQQVPELLQGVQQVLQKEQLSRVTPDKLVQLLRDVHKLVNISSSRNTVQGNSSSSKSSSAAGFSFKAAVSYVGDFASPVASAGTDFITPAWLSAVAAALQPKLLLLPHGSSLLQALQLLQSLGLENPGSSFMDSWYAAVDALLDTFSGHSVLELFAAATSVGQLPSQQLTRALLQHLTPLKLTPADVASGMSLLAAANLRPGAELLANWFVSTQAVAEQLDARDILRMLRSSCQWQVLPPSDWLDGVLRGLVPPGRLSCCSPATAAGICHCLWQLGVEPSPAFITAVTAAAQHSILAAVAAAGQQQQGSVHFWDAESFSVLCFCLFFWQQPVTPLFKAAAAAQAEVVLPYADGPSLLRLAVYLFTAFGSDEGDEEQGWHRAVMNAICELLPVAGDHADEITITGDGVEQRRARLPFEALSTLYVTVLSPMNYSDTNVLKEVRQRVVYGAGAQLLSSWDIVTLLPMMQELGAVIEQLVREAHDEVSFRWADLELQQLQADMHELVKVAYQQREGAHSAVQITIPRLAQDVALEMPAVSLKNLKASVAAANQREQQLQDALLLAAQGGVAVPDGLIEGLDEIAVEDGLQGLAEYLESPFMAAVLRRFRRVGGSVSEEWVLKGIQ